MELSQLASDAAKKLNRHAPSILTAFSVIGIGATAYLFHRAGRQAERHIQHEVRVNEEFEERFPTRLEEAEFTWHYYIIPLSIGIATATCMISATVLSSQRQATLMGAYALAERTIAKYRTKITEFAGFNAESHIREEVIKDVARETVVNPNVFAKDAEGTLYLDVFSGQQFRSDDETVHKAMDDTNVKCEEEGFASLNYFYDRVGARTTQLGEILGWTDGFPLEVTLTPVVFEDGTEGYGLDYVRMPFMGYYEV